MPGILKCLAPSILRKVTERIRDIVKGQRPGAEGGVVKMQKMSINLKKKDILTVIILTILFAITTTLVWRIFGIYTFIAALTISFMFMLFGIFEVYRRITKNIDEIRNEMNQKRKNEYLQVESLQWLYTTLRPNAPLPNTRGWAASPDFLKLISEIILTEKPQFILEVGSGVSTLVSAYCLKQVGRGGKIVTLEHDPVYANTSKSHLLQHNLQDFATVIYAPLTETSINGKNWLWYKMDNVKLDRPIDFLIIDGPPEATQKLARYPALPILFNRLKNGAIVILDDGNRNDEKEAVRLWREEYPSLECKFIPLEKGAFHIQMIKEGADNKSFKDVIDNPEVGFLKK